MKNKSCWLSLLGLVALSVSGIAAACNGDPAQCSTHNPGPQVVTAAACSGDPAQCSSHNPQLAATGLGQAWPNAADVSRSPKFHAYVFALGGIKFVQVNDLNGNVLGAVASAGDQFITLPVGRFAQLVTTPQQAPAIASSATAAKSIPVYQDGATTVLATPLSDGTLQLMAANGTCQDPIECSSRFNQPSATAATCSGDPAQCSSHLPQAVSTANAACDPAICNTHPQAQAVISAACDPAICNTHPQQVQAMTAASCTGDPAQCSTHPQTTPLLAVATPIAPADSCTRTHDPEICNSH